MNSIRFTLLLALSLRVATAGAQTISSATDQAFLVGDAATAAETVTITDHGSTPVITDTSNLRIRIPTGFNMIWDTTVTSVTIGGGASGKVSGTLLSYENGNKTLVLDVTSDFAASDQITVSGQKFTTFSDSSAVDNLELDWDNDATGDATDDKTIEIRDLPTVSVVKSTLVTTDPVNGGSNPKSIPGATVRMKITVTNTGGGWPDLDTVFIGDAIPANSALYVNDLGGGGSGPVIFTDGGVASGLTYTFTSLASTTDDVDFSDDSGSTWTYTPVADGDGFDANVTDIRINPQGVFAPKVGANEPSFDVEFDTRVD